MHYQIATAALIAASCATSAAGAQDFSFGGRKVTCKDAAAYRDGQLYAEFANAIDNFDTTREARVNATIERFKADVNTLVADIEKADALKQRKIAVAVAGIVLGSAADKLATVGVKQTLSAVEQHATKAFRNPGRAKNTD